MSTLEEMAEEEAKKEKPGYQAYVPGMPEVAPKPISFAQAIAPTITLTRLDFGTYARQEVTTRLPGFQLRDIFGPAAARPARPYGPAWAPAIGAAPTPEAPVGRLPTLEEVVKQAQAIAYVPPTVIREGEIPAAAPTPPPMVTAPPTPRPTPTPTVTTGAGPGPERPVVYEPVVYQKPPPATTTFIPPSPAYPIGGPSMEKGFIPTTPTVGEYKPPTEKGFIPTAPTVGAYKGFPELSIDDLAREEAKRSLGR